jgi:preprotein translocase subunit Sec61beta
MAKGKISMPSAQGGLVRYFDEEYKSRFIFKPQWVAVAVVAVCALVIAFHAYGAF